MVFSIEASVGSPDAFGGLRLARRTRPLVQWFPCAGHGAFLLRSKEVGVAWVLPSRRPWRGNGRGEYKITKIKVTYKYYDTVYLFII